MPPVQSRWVRSNTIAISRKLVLCCFFPVCALSNSTRSDIL